MSSLTDLPPELLDHITSYLPTASSVSNLSRSSKSLERVVEKDGWATFNRSRFPSIHLPHPRSTPPSPSYQKDAARTLVTLSRNWDRRAFAARYLEPSGHIRSFPSGQKVERWKRPRGQTIGFTPQLDSYELVGQRWSDRREVLSLSAGAEICVREKKSGRRSGGGRGEDVRWVMYRPDGAVEGRDDVTSLHLLRPQREGEGEKAAQVVRGTANGALELQTLPFDIGGERDAGIGNAAATRTFPTDDLPVRSTSLLQRPSHPSLLAAALGETRICLYSLTGTTEDDKVPLSHFDVPRPQNGARTYRTWSTNFISPTSLAVGLGPSEEPVHIYTLTPSGIDKDCVRKFSLQNDLDRLEGEITLSNFAKKSTSSVYPIVPLPSTATGGGEGSLFLSGAYDGVIRLHDLRSDRHVEGAYVDPTDDSAVYSLLPRGREKLVVGTSRHSVMKVFDLRMGARCYSYLSTFRKNMDGNEEAERDGWNLFLKPHSATYPGRGGGNNWARRSAESSIYSLTSPSPTSPYIYAGVENAVVELTFTDLVDDAPDPAFFDPNPVALDAKGVREHGVARVGDVLNLAMYEQNAVRMDLMSQRSVGEVRKLMRRDMQESWKGSWFIQGLDARWRVGT
jgi:hypothetical protein